MTGHMRGDARKRRSPETDAPTEAVAHNGQLSDTTHPSLAKYRQWHEEARREAADLRAENQRLLGEMRDWRDECLRWRTEAEWGTFDQLIAERDDLRAENQRLQKMLDNTESQIHEPNGFIDRLVDADAEVEALRAQRDRLAGIVERVKGLADEPIPWLLEQGHAAVYRGDLIYAIEGDGGES